MFDLQGERDAQQQDLTALQRLVDTLAEEEATAHEIEVTLRQAHYAEAVGDYPAATVAAQKAMAASKRQNDLLRQAESLNQLGLTARRQGDFKGAGKWYRQAVDSFQKKSTYTREEAEAYIQILNGLGVVFRQQGEIIEATSNFELALELSRSQNYRRYEAEALNHLGVTAFYQRDFNSALAFHQQALTIRQAIGDRAGEGTSLFNLAIALRDQGNYGQAQEIFEKALNIQQSTGNLWEETNVWISWGILNQELGMFNDAESCLQKALQLCRKINDESGVAFVLCNLGLLQYEMGKPTLSEQTLLSGLAVAQAQSDTYLEASFYNYLSLVNLQSGQFDKVFDQANQALTLRESLGIHSKLVDSFSTLAAGYLNKNDLHNALDYANKSRIMLDEAGGEGPEFPQRDYFICFQVFVAARQHQQAKAALQSAYDLVMDRAKKITDPKLRQSFLENVPINRDIVRTYTSNSHLNI
ncbi:MAG: tetratricopeptide repeat protein [Anaerolineae bacterium]|nr:tetratricopeptide repeat protein [Anaerolineae bacterium]